MQVLIERARLQEARSQQVVFAEHLASFCIESCPDFAPGASDWLSESDFSFFGAKGPGEVVDAVTNSAEEAAVVKASDCCNCRWLDTCQMSCSNNQTNQTIGAEAAHYWSDSHSGGGRRLPASDRLSEDHKAI